MIERNKLFTAQEEVRELQRLLQEAYWRERKILKMANNQVVWDQLCEYFGY